MNNSTIDYYKNNAKVLMERYNSADMSSLHSIISKYIIAPTTVIDIGFGSGRDILFLRSLGCDVYGVDPVEDFVEFAQKHFEKPENFIVGSFNSDFPNAWKSKFDILISIAVWMHLKPDEYPQAINSMKYLLAKGGMVILSFSVGARQGLDGRYFETLNADNVTGVFAEYGFKVIDVFCNIDGLGRDTIDWVTVILRND